MIFSASKNMYQAVLLGEKTLTTRLNLPAHIAVGKEWAIVPKRGAPAWWFGQKYGQRFVVTDPRAYVVKLFASDFYRTISDTSLNRMLRDEGFIRARIRIDDYWETPLGDMTEREAREEGVTSVHEYARLWTAINPHVEWWSHLNFRVHRIRFSVPQDVAQAVSCVGRQAILDAAKAVQA